MKLIDQRTKKIMEECKQRARDAGLSFESETLEYIVTNRDLNELEPKGMIPTLYDFWVEEVEVIKKQEIYKLYPYNPYETVINTRPAISFYNDNNPDWLNIMIFYHVIAHIDFFQNNIFFQQTWDYDFTNKALADKRLINSLRSEYGRWVDYVIEFSRCINNLTNYHTLLAKKRKNESETKISAIDYYFQVFLQEEKKLSAFNIKNQIDKYNKLVEETPEFAQNIFLADIIQIYPDFNSKYQKYIENIEKQIDYNDIYTFILENSEFLNKEQNKWMKSVVEIVRETAIYFEPQLRTKIMNEGWASYWHNKLFLTDERIKGHESQYAKINAQVTSLSRIGLNPYAIGMRLFEFIEEYAEKGKFTREFQNITDLELRNTFQKNSLSGKDTIFEVRKYFNDFTFLNTFINQDFVDKYNLFVVGKKINPESQTIDYYIKSRKAEDYKKMLISNLYHPPYVTIDKNRTNEKNLYLVHYFEGKQLIKEFIPETLIGIEFLWGNQVQLETTEITIKDNKKEPKKVLYTCKNRNVNKVDIIN